MKLLAKTQLIVNEKNHATRLKEEGQHDQSEKLFEMATDRAYQEGHPSLEKIPELALITDLPDPAAKRKPDSYSSEIKLGKVRITISPKGDRINLENSESGETGNIKLTEKKILGEAEDWDLDVDYSKLDKGKVTLSIGGDSKVLNVAPSK